jgi:hypothetical protein
MLPSSNLVSILTAGGPINFAQVSSNPSAGECAVLPATAHAGKMSGELSGRPVKNRIPRQWLIRIC